MRYRLLKARVVSIKVLVSALPSAEREYLFLFLKGKGRRCQAGLDQKYM